jgi:hypothetical protein
MSLYLKKYSNWWKFKTNISLKKYLTYIKCNSHIYQMSSYLKNILMDESLKLTLV